MVGCAAGGIGDDELDRTVRIRLRAHTRRAKRGREQQHHAVRELHGSSFDALAASQPPTLPPRTGGVQRGPLCDTFPHARHQHARAHVRRAQPEVARAPPGTRSSRRPTSMRLPRAARASRRPIRPARSAYRRARHLPSARYIHEIGYWDNADGYDGAIPSWHHRTARAGHRVVSIGKLHFRGRPGDDHGFSEEIVPMHIFDGIGDVKGLVRENMPKRKGGDKMAQARRPRRVDLHRVRPRHRRARAGLAARGGAEVARPALGAVRVVRRAAFSAHRAAAVVLPLLEAGPADAQAVRQRRAAASSLPRRLRAHGRLRRHFDDRGRCQAGDRRVCRPRVNDGRERRQRAARAARRGPGAATRA